MREARFFGFRCPWVLNTNTIKHLSDRSGRPNINIDSSTLNHINKGSSIYEQKGYEKGSFDKGFYFSIPVKLFYSDYRTGSISFGLHPLTKDGGAILNQHNALFSILGDTNESTIKRDWKYIYE